jgi:uncharacterized protein (TIGR03083 family)
VSTLKPLEPVATVDHIREIDDALEGLLSSLTPKDWLRPAVKDWRVRDVAAHLLDTNLRRLSLDRDRHLPEGVKPPSDPESFQSWVGVLNRLNAEWTVAAERLSPGVILELLRVTNAQVSEYFAGLDPEGPATFGVRWARESETRVWLDVAREYTEKWHHQQQIREAVGQPLLSSPHLLVPLIEALLRAVPPAYDGVEAGVGTSVLIIASDLDDGRWLLRRDHAAWNLYHPDEATTPDATITTGSETLWRFLMKQVSRDEARSRSSTSGDAELVAPFFEAVAVMA